MAAYNKFNQVRVPETFWRKPKNKSFQVKFSRHKV